MTIFFSKSKNGSNFSTVNITISEVGICCEPTEKKIKANQLTVSRDVIILLPDVQSRVKLNIKSRIL